MLRNGKATLMRALCRPGGSFQYSQIVPDYTGNMAYSGLGYMYSGYKNSL